MTGFGNGQVTILDDVSNGAEKIIDATRPMVVEVDCVGVVQLLQHAWNIEAIDAKAKAAKGSDAKKTDDIESYLHRDPDTGFIGIPGINLVAAMRDAGRYMQDPRSPRKSAMDLVKSGVMALDPIAPFLDENGEPNKTTYDFEHRARVVVQRSGVTRTRPGFNAGWRCRFRIMITTPEYLNMPVVTKLINDAGRLFGFCDFRPTYGRFTVSGIRVVNDESI